MLIGIYDSEIIPKLCWFSKRKKSSELHFTHLSPSTLIPVKSLFVLSLPVHLCKFSFAVISPDFQSSTPKIILLQNCFSSYEITWRRKLVWEGVDGFVSGSHFDLMWRCEAGSPALPFARKAVILDYKKSEIYPSVACCFSSLQPSLFSSGLPLGYNSGDLPPAGYALWSLFNGSSLTRLWFSYLYVDNYLKLRLDKV